MATELPTDTGATSPTSFPGDGTGAQESGFVTTIAVSQVGDHVSHQFQDQQVFQL
jgi:hypothetical protein